MKKYIFVLLLSVFAINVGAQSMLDNLRSLENDPDCNLNDPNWQSYLAGGYLTNGDGQRGLEFANKAAKQGEPYAHYYLYKYNTFVDINYRKAKEHLFNAMTSDNENYTQCIPAFCEYARLSLDGNSQLGITKDSKTAIDLLNQCIPYNYPDAFLYLSNAYFLGNGVNKDLNKALSLITQGINLFDEKVMSMEFGWAPAFNGDVVKFKLAFYNNRGAIYREMRNKEKALECWREIVSMFPFQVETYQSGFKEYIKNEDPQSVDLSIPQVSMNNSNTYVLIISNENYQKETKVPFAINDGCRFASYCKKTLGIPQNNIIEVYDATLSSLRSAIGRTKQTIQTHPNTNLIVYYSGHGVPDEATASAYMLPVDGSASNFRTGYSVKRFYDELGGLPAKQTIVFMDACFSGAKREGGMLVDARGVAIKVKEEQPTGNLIIFSAAQGDETAYPYNEKVHGLFTYFLLKKIQESKGAASVKEISDYVISEVRKKSITANGKLQTPSIIAPNSIDLSQIRLR